MEVLAQARIVVWEGASLWVVNAKPAEERRQERTDFHAHHAIQVTVSLGGWFTLATSDKTLSDGIAVVAADVPHEFDAEGLVALIFIEPESRLGRAVARRLLGDADVAAVPPDLLSDFPARIASNFGARHHDNASLIAIGRALVAQLAEDSTADVLDFRVRKMIVWAGEQLDARASLAGAVGISGLSASRLRHLFVEQTGLPFKTYMLWLRLTRAVEVLAGGTSLTEAAHASGFTDSAHLSRTFRRMFGVAPSALRMS